MESSVLSSKFLSSCRHCRPFQTQWEVCGVDVLVTSLPLHRLPLQLNQLIGVTLQYSGSYATQDLWDTRQWIFFSAQPYSKESKLFQGFYINYDLLMHCTAGPWLMRFSVVRFSLVRSFKKSNYIWLVLIFIKFLHLCGK